MQQFTRIGDRFKKGLSHYYYFFQHGRKLGIESAVYKSLARFGPAYTGRSELKLFGKNITITSPFWFLHSLDEIFVQEVYKFNPVSKEPLIIDCGSNIGLSVLYFKKQFPHARIIAFEADPQILPVLQNNLDAFSLGEVQVINGAVWKEYAKVSFASDGAVGGKVEKNEGDGSMIAAYRLKDFLEQEVDFLKMDIEGAEYEVLKDCREPLANVRNLFLEYHVLPGETQHLHEILEWISQAGFRYYIREAWPNMRYPFSGKGEHFYQMQLNISCFRQ